MNGLKILAGAALALAAITTAHANDSTAELAAGGLILTHSDGIEMRSEDLFISREAVRVSYRFRNVTDKDIKVLVAFPMPDITGSIDFMDAVPTEDPDNILGFKTTVDGMAVTARAERKAIANGTDQTALLRGLHISLAPHLGAAGKALNGLSKVDQDRFVKLGLAIPDDYDQGKGWEHHLQPAWTLTTTYYWEQVFPAGRDLAVEHSYTPSVGQSVGTGLGRPWLKGAELAAMRGKYCIDDAFMAAVSKRQKAVGDEALGFSEARIDYVLSSGGNWKKPIGDFHLTIDKGRPDSLVSFCATNVKKTGPTRFESRRTDFRPAADLAVLILDPTQ